MMVVPRAVALVGAALLVLAVGGLVSGKVSGGNRFRGGPDKKQKRKEKGSKKKGPRKLCHAALHVAALRDGGKRGRRGDMNLILLENSEAKPHPAPLPSFPGLVPGTQ